MRLIRGRRKAMIGFVFLLIFAVSVLVVSQKPAILAALRSGESVEIKFPRNDKLEEDSSVVKLAGVEIGLVTDIAPSDNGGPTEVTATVDDEAWEKLGAKPTAAIRPTTILGGKYYVELTRGGGNGTFDGEPIPTSRTSTPEELDDVLGAVPPRAQQGVRRTTEALDKTLASGGKESLKGIFRDAPSTLRPAQDVFTAMLGTRPDTDLTELVRNVETIAEVVTREDGQLGRVVDTAGTTASTLSNQREPLARTVRDLPATLDSLRVGLGRLGGSLDRLRTTAPAIRPAIAEAKPLLDALKPALTELRPLMTDLRPVLRDARPSVEQLTPGVQQTTRVLQDINGKPLERLNGPITDYLNEKWVGKGPFAGGGNNGHKLYEEIGYLFSTLDKVGMRTAANGAVIGLHAGVGPSSAMGLPGGLDDLLVGLERMTGRPPDKVEGGGQK